MKKFLITSALLASQSVMAFGDGSTLKCRIVETEGDTSTTKYVQQTYNLETPVDQAGDTDHIVADSRFVDGVHIDIWGCVSCTLINGARTSEIDATFTDKKTGVESNATHVADFATGTISVGGQDRQIVAYVCSIAKPK